ncbi:MAG TPA: hypothetical protein VFZ66_23100 [Herpetosiphonaceae bacterium]
MADDPTDESPKQPPELRPGRTRGRVVPDATAAAATRPATDRAVLRSVAAHYLVQHERLVPLGTAARFGRDAAGQPYLELPLSAGHPLERLAIEDVPPRSAVVQTALVSRPRGAERDDHVLGYHAPTARAAQDGIDEAILQYVIDEVGLEGVERMVQQLCTEGPTTQFDPSPRRSSRRRRR